MAGFPHGRRTIHDYRAEPVDEEAVLRALAAAQEAPCHKLTWPWRFTRVGPRARRRLTDLNVQLKGERRALTPPQEARLRERMENPAVLLVVSQVRAADPHRSREDYAAVACAVQNLCLSLHADGIGTKWSSGAVTRHPSTYGILGIEDAVEEIVGFVWIGLPAVVPAPPVRPPLGSVYRAVD